MAPGGGVHGGVEGGVAGVLEGWGRCHLGGRGARPGGQVQGRGAEEEGGKAAEEEGGEVAEEEVQRRNCIERGAATDISERAVKTKVALPSPSILSVPSEVIALEIFGREMTF